MKFLIVLTSILFTCSVTTASPILPTATATTYSSSSTISNAKVTNSAGPNEVSENAIDSTKDYLETKEAYEKAEKTHSLLKFEKLCQEKLIEWLLEEYRHLSKKSWKRKNSKHKKELKELEFELQAQHLILSDLEKKCTKSCLNSSQLRWKSGGAKTLLAESLLEKNSDLKTTDYHTKLDAPHSPVLSQKSESDQASTSGTHSPSHQALQHHQSPSPSTNETPAVQRTQTSSSTQTSSKRSRR
ncbi:hypothetical protein BDEG_26725 [Batrachochytrium dendrobatidis JEL423]|uniref:Uncharacterized protein n=1 Tax=Batrachochytrium dendrobatidis (strain JEL423) TaxID=403673 RepID=A0A177WT91_BATDL|nr:hypothetical protein BDEG_26725 [Batrachochytrium dendrobatidis JEL423]